MNKEKYSNMTEIMTHSQKKSGIINVFNLENREVEKIKTDVLRISHTGFTD